MQRHVTPAMPQSTRMQATSLEPNEPLDALVQRGLVQLRALSPQVAALLEDAAFTARVTAVIVASDFALETLRRQPGLLEKFASDDGAATFAPPVLFSDDPTSWPGQLRRYRAAESTRLVWRDVLGLDDVDAILAGSTRLAETCLQTALDALEVEFAQRHGHVRASDGTLQRLVVFGLGKLGAQARFGPAAAAPRRLRDPS